MYGAGARGGGGGEEFTSSQQTPETLYSNHSKLSFNKVELLNLCLAALTLLLDNTVEVNDYKKGLLREKKSLILILRDFL